MIGWIQVWVVALFFGLALPGQLKKQSENPNDDWLCSGRPQHTGGIEPWTAGVQDSASQSDQFCNDFCLPDSIMDPPTTKPET